MTGGLVLTIVLDQPGDDHKNEAEDAPKTIPWIRGISKIQRELTKKIFAQIKQVDPLAVFSH
jgi:hypothetical protein